MNRPADAIAAGERAVKANPSNPEANWILGSLYARMSETPNTRQADRRPTPARHYQSREREPQRASWRADDARTAVPCRWPARQSDRDARAVCADQPDQVDAVAMLAEAIKPSTATPTPSRCLRNLLKMRLSCSARSVRRISPGRWPDAARAFGAPSKIGRRACRSDRSGRPRS